MTPSTSSSVSEKPEGAIVVEANWRHNRWFTDVLEAERQLDLKRWPERYDHIWEGGYARAFEGAYFASVLNAAKAEGRIGSVSADPLLPLRAFFDLGGSGASADAMAIWIVQWVGQEIRVLDYIEGVGQVLAYYVDELRRRQYGRAICYLPHDGVNANAITGKRYEDHLREAGFEVQPPVANQGRGAAMMRVEAVRRHLSRSCGSMRRRQRPDATRWATTTSGGMTDRNVGLGPEHRWASHAADALGLMAICYEEPSRVAGFGRKLNYPKLGIA